MNVYKNSELNAAACHSSPEAKLAEILDCHADIAAWVRNFRLGWTVPWFDIGAGSWARMEPDFVAKANQPNSSGRNQLLVIEFKGLKAGEPSEVAKQKYLEDCWVPAVSRLSADGEDYGEWHAVWIEEIDDAEAQISSACKR